MAQEIQSQYFCLTSYDHSIVWDEHFFLSLPDLNYLVYQFEICPDTSRRHRQAYIEWARPTRWTAIKTAFGDKGIHCEKRRGSSKQAIAYCKKEDSRDPTVGSGPFEFGFPYQRRDDSSGGGLQEAIECLKETKSIKAVATAHAACFIRYGRGLRDWNGVVTDGRDWKPTVIVFWGYTGLGKTRRAREQAIAQFGRDGLWEDKDPGTDWFDGYDGQPCVLIDEFSGGISYRLFLRALDRYSCRVQVKGGSIHWLPKMIYITSNISPKLWFHKEDYDPLERRLDHIVCFEQGQ